LNSMLQRVNVRKALLKGSNSFLRNLRPIDSYS
jgi:hypothetical protein